MAKYKFLINDSNVLDTETMATIPVEHNSYQEWLAQGNTPDPADIIDPLIAIRAERDRLLAIADIEINKLEDIGGDATLLREHRETLRNVPSNFPNADIATFDWSAI